MDEKAPSVDPQNIMDGVIGALRDGRNRSMQQRKAVIQREFMIARRWIEDAYCAFQPEDLPVDVHRIKRDLAITRDQIVDSACAEVDKEFRIAMGVFKVVAQQHPGYYVKAARTTTQPRSWKRPLPTVTAPKIARVLPSRLLEVLSAAHISEVVNRLLKARQGITFNELAKDMGLGGDDQLQARSAVKEFASFLRANDHVTVVGTGRGQKMKASKSLQQLRDTLVEETEAL